MPEPQSQIERINLLESINSIPHMDMNITMAQVFSLLHQRNSYCKYKKENSSDEHLNTYAEYVKRINNEIKMLLKTILILIFGHGNSPTLAH